MCKIVVRWYDGEEKRKLEFDNIDEATECYDDLYKDSSVKGAKLELVTTTELKTFWRS